MASVPELIAHGSNLDEIGAAAFVVALIVVIGFLGWRGGRRERERERD